MSAANLLVVDDDQNMADLVQSRLQAAGYGVTTALSGRAALRAVGYTRDTRDFPGSLIERDKDGEPTGIDLGATRAALAERARRLWA